MLGRHVGRWVPSAHGRRRRARPHTNRLAGETSPYLLQHAHNPVDWFPWGQDALARAALLDRPIFLSIGYAACHWCHVMERESFEDEATAAALNAGFVAIKVDREERPDLDQLYMGAVQAMTGGGGWPMSVFLTPEGRPFYGGTYFPDTPRHGLPSFRQVLEGVRAAWTTQRAELEQSAGRMVDALVAAQALRADGAGCGRAALPGPEVLDGATAGIVGSFDRVHGGWGRAPKFPQPMTIEFLLRRHVATGDEATLEVALRSLAAMAAGGIHDQLGGGFHRYATDARWLVPHFEQMLYDNAQLARVYAHAWALTGDAALLADADRGARLRRPGADDARRRVRGEPGRRHGRRGGRDLHLDRRRGARGPGRRGGAVRGGVRRDRRGQLGGPDDPVARPRRRRARGAVRAGGGRGRAAARGLAVVAAGARGRRAPSPPATTRCSRPGTGSRSPRSPTHRGRWPPRATRTWRRSPRAIARRRPARPMPCSSTSARPTAASGGRGATAGRRRTACWRTTPTSPRGCSRCTRRRSRSAGSTPPSASSTSCSTHFAHPDGGFYDTPDDGERLVVRPRDVQDNATPSGRVDDGDRPAAARGVDRRGPLPGRRPSARSATLGPLLERHPTAFAQWLSALAAAHAPSTEVAIVGEPAAEDTRRLTAAVDRGYHPFRVQAASATPETSTVPLLHDRLAIDGRPTAFVCHRFACRLPVDRARGPRGAPCRDLSRRRPRPRSSPGPPRRSSSCGLARADPRSC